METTVSLIVPVYKGKEYIGKCIDSLINQDFDLPYEIILCEFGSDEEVIEICDNYENKYYGLVNVIHSDINYGISASRNAGICAARGKYVSFVDSDDCLQPDFLSKMYCFAEKGNFDIVTSGFYMYPHRRLFTSHHASYKGTGKKLITKFFLSKGCKYQVYCWGRLYKKTLLDDFKLRFPSYMPIYEDWPFFIETFVNAGKVGYLRKYLYHYIQNPSSATHIQRDSVFYNLKALKIARDYLFDHDPVLARKLFKKVTFSIRLHLLWDSIVCHKLYGKSIIALYKEAKIKAEKIYQGKPIDYLPK